MHSVDHSVDRMPTQLPGPRAGSTVMVRQVDDALLLTDSLAVAASYVQRMTQGVTVASWCDCIVCSYCSVDAYRCILSNVRFLLPTHRCAGFPDYGISINPKKTKTSFPCPALGTSEAHGLYIAPDNTRHVQWCGLLINVDTLEFQVGCSSMTLCHTPAHVILATVDNDLV